MQCIHNCSKCTSSILFASCKWGFCPKMFAIQRYWGSFHSCVRSRTGVNAESKRVKMRFAGVFLRIRCVIDSGLAFFDFWIAIPRRQRNCNRGCTACCLKFKAKKYNSQWQNRHWIAQKTTYQMLITPRNKFISCAS